jgi:hypothetical protein
MASRRKSLGLWKKSMGMAQRFWKWSGIRRMRPAMGNPSIAGVQIIVVPVVTP